MTIVATHCPCGISELIARQCPGVTIVVEGNCPKLFYNGFKPPNYFTETIQCEYPLEVEKIVNGRMKKALVVNSFINGKYIGKLYMKLNDSGDIETFHGNSLVLDHTFPEDDDISKRKREAQKLFDNGREEISGYSRVKLSAADCMKEECTLGSLVTEAMIAGRAKELEDGKKYAHWSDVYVSFTTHSSFFGGKSLTDKTGFMTSSNVQKGLVNFRMFVVEVRGTTLKKVFDNLTVLEKHGEGGFLQMRGVKARIDRDGHETDIKLLIPKKGYQPLLEDLTYVILIDQNLYNGSSSQNFNFVDKFVHRPLLCGKTSHQALMFYMEHNRVFYPIIESNVVFFSSKGSWSYVSDILFGCLILNLLFLTIEL